jgi:hypothetical protein
MYLNDSIVYQASDMILCAHAAVGFLSMNPNLAAEQEHTSFYRRMTTFHDSTASSSRLPKSSSLFWHLLLNLNLLLFLSQPVR